ncbi:conserved hypothetical protein, partial [Ricinus communis]
MRDGKEVARAIRPDGSAQRARSAGVDRPARLRRISSEHFLVIVAGDLHARADHRRFAGVQLAEIPAQVAVFSQRHRLAARVAVGQSQRAAQRHRREGLAIEARQHHARLRRRQHVLHRALRDRQCRDDAAHVVGRRVGIRHLIFDDVARAGAIRGPRQYLAARFLLDDMRIELGLYALLGESRGRKDGGKQQAAQQGTRQGGAMKHCHGSFAAAPRRAKACQNREKREPYQVLRAVAACQNGPFAALLSCCLQAIDFSFWPARSL